MYVSATNPPGGARHTNAKQDPEIQKLTGETDPVAIVTKLREMKNDFK